MKLISMTDFVLYQTEFLYEKNQSKLVHNIVNYAQFLKQPLKLEMFVACDEKGNILKEPMIQDCKYDDWQRLYAKYKKSKEKVLFEGFEVKRNYIMYYDFMYMMTYELENKNIESIIEEIPNNNLTLTPNATKQFL